MIFSYICSIGDGNEIKPYIEIIDVTGGTPPYYYSLTGLAHQTGTTFNNLVYGNHIIHVSDSSGLDTAYKAIYIPKPPQISTHYEQSQSENGLINIDLILDTGIVSQKYTDENGNVWWISKQNPYFNLC
jgi:hypothetical protein